MDFWQIILTVCCVLFSLLTLISNRIILSALGLFLFLLSLAGIFHYLGMEFLALSQFVVAISIFSLLYVFSHKIAIKDSLLKEDRSSRLGIVFSVTALLSVAGIMSTILYFNKDKVATSIPALMDTGGFEYFSSLVEKNVLAIEMVAVFIVVIIFALAMNINRDEEKGD